MISLIQKVAMFVLRKTTKSNAVDFANSEFTRAGWVNESGKFDDDMQKLICENVTDLLCVMSLQGHSGFSASYMLSLFGSLSKFEPITPLTGADSEWVEVGDDTLQNKFCGSVFKRISSGKSYWLDHYVFEDETGRFTSRMSKQPVTFPWVKPDSIVVKVERDSEGSTIYPEFVKEMEL